MPTERGLYILLLSIHGLLRGRSPELGKDADTGGQILYALELARALIAHPDVERVDLLTRRIEGADLDEDYAQPEEPLAPGLTIVRIPCGPRRYLRKELLWPHLETFVDNTIHYLRSIAEVPDLIHGHYADAGLVASKLSSLLDVPMAFTGHSLGRVKRQRLLDAGTSPESIEKRYHISRRIEAEETALHHAAFVVASTHQEVEEQYATYEYYQRRCMLVVPPGVDLSRYAPPKGRQRLLDPVREKIRPFLVDLRKPIVLSISRADPRKNIGGLIRAFGQNERLRELANLVIVAGNRDDLQDLDTGAREVLDEMLHLIDLYDLYGSVAYPKHHHRDEIPLFYWLAAGTYGVFVNPALTEPFGLTLLEASASGLPVVATDDGGPRDILTTCGNGVLVDPLDEPTMGQAILDAIEDRSGWKAWARRGLTAARGYSWSGHVNKYMRAARTAVKPRRKERRFFGMKSRLITADRVVVCDIDNTLIGDRKALAELLEMLRAAGTRVAVGIATGRSLELTLDALREWKIPTPQLSITSVGSAIHYSRNLIQDQGWERHIRYGWRADAVREAMRALPGLELQPEAGQGPFKISYDVDPRKMAPVREIRRHLRNAKIRARVIYSHNAYLDVLPIRASKGMALRYFCLNWGIPLERCLVAGDSGNDAEMLTANTLGVVVGNHDSELDSLRGQPNVYFARGHYARGIAEGILHYDFLGNVRAHETETTPNAATAGK